MLILSTDTARQEVSDLLLLEDMKIWRGGWQQSADLLSTDTNSLDKMM
jgi:hypothetical protein